MEHRCNPARVTKRTAHQRGETRTLPRTLLACRTRPPTHSVLARTVNRGLRLHSLLYTRFSNLLPVEKKTDRRAQRKRERKRGRERERESGRGRETHVHEHTEVRMHTVALCMLKRVRAKGLERGGECTRGTSARVHSQTRTGTHGFSNKPAAAYTCAGKCA